MLPLIFCFQISHADFKNLDWHEKPFVITDDLLYHLFAITDKAFVVMKHKTPLINLKAIRSQAGLSLSQVCSLTGVSKAMLHQIERGESSPTIATLWKLALGFRLPLTAFLVDQDLRQADGADLSRQIGEGAVRFPDGLQVQTIFAFDPCFGSETFLLTLEPGQEHLSEPHMAGIVEDVFVVTGIMEFLFDGQWHSCKAGEGIRFCADQAHGYRNVMSEPAQFHNVMHYPSI